MPELPEVEFTLRQLRPAMEKARFVRVMTRRADLRYPFPADFASRLERKTVRSLQRRAKYLVAELSTGDLLVMHLGMSGSFRISRRAGGRQSASAYEKHDHVVFEMSSGRTVIFNDPRRFGFMKILPAADTGADWTEGAIGPEPLDARFDGTVLAAALCGRKTTIKSALLDQRVVAGLGNIYACEALHRAGLSPRRKASTLATRSGGPTDAMLALVRAIKQTLRDAIAHNHRVSGEDRFRVYDREGEACPRRGCPGTINRIVQAGRSTFFCPVCQK